RIFDLGLVDRQFKAGSIADAAHHELRGERPRLAGDVAHARNADPGFLEHFARDRFLHRLARLDEAGERRNTAFRKARLPAGQELPFTFDEHDRHWIHAREVLRVAGWAIALPAAFGRPGPFPAL